METTAQHRLRFRRRARAIAFVKAITIAVASISGSICFAGPAAAQSANLAIVFDGSGSMWGKVEGASGAKFQNARDALQQAIAKAGDRAPRVGIFGFGFRRRGTCGSTETIAAFADDVPPQTQLLSLGRFNPRGRGPLAAAMIAAGTALEARSGPRHLLLLHDDNDNCRQDVCAVARDLKAKMPNLSVHALTLRPTTSPPLLACLTEVSGGTVVQTLTVSEMAEGLARIVSLSERPGQRRRPGNRDDETTGSNAQGAEASATAPPTAPAGVTTRDGPTSLVVAANLAASGPRYIGRVRWEIKPVSRSSAAEARVTIADTASFKLSPGAYSVTASTPLVTSTTNVNVAKDKITVLVADLNAGAITFAAKLGEGADPIADARLIVRKTKGDGQVDPGPPALVGTMTTTAAILPQGSYLVSARKGQLEETIRLDVLAGAAQTVPMRLPGARLKIRLQRPAPDDGAPPPTLIVEELVPAETNTWREVARTSNTEADVLILPSTYRITAVDGLTSVRRQVIAKRGQSIDVDLSLRPVSVTLSTEIAALPGQSPAATRYEIKPLDRPDAQARGVFDSGAPVMLLPGRYRITSVVDRPKSRVTRDIVVSPRQSQTVTFQHGVGRLTLRMVSPRQTRRQAQTDWVVRTAAGAAVWRGIGASRQALLPPGTYIVQAGDGSQFRREVVLEQGRSADVSFATR